MRATRHLAGYTRKCVNEKVNTVKNFRQKLIDATFEEVYSCGYNGASLAKILATAEVKKGSMYYYFSSKKEMVLAMIAEKIGYRLKSKWEKAETENTNIVDNIIAIFQDTKNWDLVNGCILGNLLQEPLGRDKDFAKALNLILEQWKEQLSQILRKAQDKNQLNKSVNTEACATFIIAAIEGALLLTKKSNNTTDFEVCMGELAFYLNNLRIDKK